MKITQIELEKIDWQIIDINEDLKGKLKTVVDRLIVDHLGYDIIISFVPISGVELNCEKDGQPVGITDKSADNFIEYFDLF